jgi:hypothetical protein
MWSCATYDLDLTDDEFFALTPRKFDALLKRQRNRRERDTEHTEFMFAQLTWWVANTGFRSTEKPTTFRDFMPSLRESTGSSTRTPTKAKRLTRQRRVEIADGLRMMFTHDRTKW